MNETPDSPDRRPDAGEPVSQWQPMPPTQPNYYGYPQGHWQPAVAKPGVIPLRPLTAGDILGGAIATIRTHPGQTLGVAAVVMVITSLVNAVATYPLLDEAAVLLDSFPSQSELMRYMGISLATTAISLVLTIMSRVFLSGFFTQVVSTAALGQRPGFRQHWLRLRPRLLPLLGLTLVYLAVALPAAAVVVGLILTVPALGVLTLLGFLVVALWLLVMFSFATSALVLENVGIGRAFGRSRELVRGSWWRVLGIILLASLITFGVAMVVTLVGGFATGSSNLLLSPPTTGDLVVWSIVGVVAGMLTEPFMAAVIVLLYTDQRIRRERLDVSLARAAGV